MPGLSEPDELEQFAGQDGTAGAEAYRPNDDVGQGIPAGREGIESCLPHAFQCLPQERDVRTVV